MKISYDRRLAGSNRPAARSIFRPTLPSLYGGDVGRGGRRGGLFLTTPGFVIRGELSLHHHLCAWVADVLPSCRTSVRLVGRRAPSA